MKVIRRGNDEGEMAPPVETAKVTCEKCGSLLEITQKDIIEDDCGAGDCVRCEACGRFSVIEVNKLRWKR